MGRGANSKISVSFTAGGRFVALPCVHLDLYSESQRLGACAATAPG